MSRDAQRYRKTYSYYRVPPRVDTLQIIVDESLDWKASVRAASTTSVPLSGATPVTIDGVSLVDEDRVLLKNQSTSSQNGIYYYEVTGGNYQFTRASDARQGTLSCGAATYVEEGTTNKKTVWILTTTGEITVDTTSPLTWEQFLGGGGGGGGSGDSYWFSTTAKAIYTTGSVAIRGEDTSIDAASDIGTDVFFYVSGSISGSNPDDKKSVFGGDVRISGSLAQAAGSVIGERSHAEGIGTAIGIGSHAEGNGTAVGNLSHAEGVAVSTGDYSHAEGNQFVTASGQYSHAEGIGAEIYSVEASGEGSHAEGAGSKATAEASHAEGYQTETQEKYSHAEGRETISSGEASHTEGYQTHTHKEYSHAEGESTNAYGKSSHVEGVGTLTDGDYSHAEGASTYTFGTASHAEGSFTEAIGDYSHAEGNSTIASGTYQHVQGKFNKRDNDFSLFVIGDGDGDANANRSDIVRVNSGITPGTGRFEVTGALAATLGLSGSLTKLVDGTSYLIAGGNISVTSASNGAVTISLDGSDGSGLYWKSSVTDAIYTTGSVAIRGTNTSINEAADVGTDVFFFVSGSITGSGAADKKAVFGGDVVVSGSLSVHEFTELFGDAMILSGSLYASGNVYVDGNIYSSGIITASHGFSGSLTRLSDGTPYLVAGPNVTITTASNGSVEISSSYYTPPTYWTSPSADNILTTGSVTITGDLTVNGDMTTVNTVNLEVKDAIIGLGFSSGTIALSANDRGIIGGIAGGDNVALIWKNVQNEFSFGRTDKSATGSLPIPLTSYANLHAANIQGSIITASIGFSGSLTKLTDNTDYLIAGTNINLTTGSKGQITISNVAPTFYQWNELSPSPELNTTASVILAGTKGSSYSTSNVGTDVFFFASGSVGSRGGSIKGVSAFGGDVVITGSISVSGSAELSGDITEISGSLLVSGTTDINGNLYANNIYSRGIITASLGFSGSLTKLKDGTDYLIAGNNVTLATGTKGEVTISAPNLAPAGAQFLTLALDSSLTNERVFTPGTGLSGTNGGANNPYTLSIDDSVVATISGSTFAGAVKFNAGLSGSLTKLTDGTSYLIAGNNTTITSASNGPVTISAIPTSPANSVQFNNAGAFGGSSNFNFYNSSNTLAITGTLGMKGDVVPDADYTYNLGASGLRWANVYTGDLHLKNDRGDWTIIEEKDYLCVVNNITGKKYKMMLQEIKDES